MHKLPCIIFTGAETCSLREAALKLVDDANLKHWIVSDCHDEQYIRQISTDIRKDPSYNKVLLFEDGAMRFPRTNPRYSTALYEFLMPQTSKLHCALGVLAPEVTRSKVYVELRIMSDFLIHMNPLVHSPLSVTPQLLADIT